MSTQTLPLLFSFRRCPYAIRARMAIFSAVIKVDIHEVSLKNKPQAMLEASSKGTVPVLCLEDKVIDESLDIMLWALTINDPDAWYSSYSEAEKNRGFALIDLNDNGFKPCLDKYKYADRFPEYSAEYYRQQCDSFLKQLNTRLEASEYLLGKNLSFADIAIFPFVRQFSMVDKAWFDQSQYSYLRGWLNTLISSLLFTQVMAKKTELAK